MHMMLDNIRYSFSGSEIFILFMMEPLRKGVIFLYRIEKIYASLAQGLYLVAAGHCSFSPQQESIPAASAIATALFCQHTDKCHGTPAMPVITPSLLFQVTSPACIRQTARPFRRDLFLRREFHTYTFTQRVDIIASAKMAAALPLTARIPALPYCHASE